MFIFNFKSILFLGMNLYSEYDSRDSRKIIIYFYLVFFENRTKKE